MRVRSALALIAFLPAAASAQVDTARGAIEGSVYDSIARRPIVGAVVQMVNALLPSGGMLSTQSDAAGRYAFRGLFPGRYLVGFQDPALDSLSLETPTLAVEVRAGQATEANLATPSPVRLVTTACQVSPADSMGLLLGVVRDAVSGMNRTQGSVEASWADLVIDRTGINTRQQRRVGQTNVEGWFAICLPAGEGIALRAASGTDSSGVQLVNIVANAIIRRDVALGGTARVRGRVRGHEERPVANARVGFAGTDRRTNADSTGAFELEGPAGTQTLEVRALGYFADRRPISLRAGTDTVIDVSLPEIKRVLDTVQVRAQRVFSRDSDGFERRRRSANGRFWNPDDVARTRPYDIYALLRQSPSISLEQTGFTRTMTLRGGVGGRCVPAVYLNGVQLLEDFVENLDLMVRPEDISGMELYTVAQAPAQYQSLNGCGSVVIWTRPGQRARR